MTIKRTTRKEARRLAMVYAGTLLVSQDWPEWAQDQGIDIDDNNAFNAFMDELKRLGKQMLNRAEDRSKATQ
jgi:hypothetical protein